MASAKAPSQLPARLAKQPQHVSHGFVKFLGQFRLKIPAKTGGVVFQNVGQLHVGQEADQALRHSNPCRAPRLSNLNST